jgi:hypothetical protein
MTEASALRSDRYLLRTLDHWGKRVQTATIGLQVGPHHTLTSRRSTVYGVCGTAHTVLCCSPHSRPSQSLSLRKSKSEYPRPVLPL